MQEKININHILDEIVKGIEEVPNSKKYWLIRTQSGTLYEIFKDNNFVGLELTEVSIKNLVEFKKTSPNDIVFSKNVKNIVNKYYDNVTEGFEITNQKIGLISNQITKFYNKVKKGDVVVIPSVNSDFISFGVVSV